MTLPPLATLEVISVAKADRPLWIYRMSLESLLKHFPAARLLIVCPSSDLSFFSSLEDTGQTLTISEEDYMPTYGLNDAACRLSARPKRAGWYYQQFLKMYYCKHAKSPSFLIWDLDTVMLNPIPLSSNASDHLFGSSSEYHLPYFRTIDRLLGPGVFPSRSAICQYMHVHTATMSSLLSHIEFHTGMDWRIGILDSLPQHDDSEFSEYETYAAYVYRSFPDKCTFSKSRLFRYGSELTSSYPDALAIADHLSRGFDLLAFERHLPSRLRKAYAYLLYSLASLDLSK